MGVGLGEQTLLTAKARDIIKTAGIVLSTQRLSEQFCSLNANIKSMSITQIEQEIITLSGDTQGDKKLIAVLASGDIGFYSIANTIKKRFSGINIDLEFISGISSLQYLTAYMQIPYDNVKVMSMHGRENNAVSFVCYNEKVFLLTGGKYKASDIIKSLVNAGLGFVTVTVGENLSDVSERIVCDTADNLLEYQFDNLAVMLIENKAFVNHHTIIKDNEFIRGKSPMTKECIRTISLAKLNIMPSDTVYDIGAGTGSVSVAMARMCYEGYVYAVEKEDCAIELIAQNKCKFGAFNVEVINAVAPDKLEDLPKPDKVFIGGSTGNLDGILDVVYAKNESAVVVVNAVTLETLSQTVNTFKSRQIKTEITCVNIANAQKLGNYNLMKSENPVYVINTVIE